MSALLEVFCDHTTNIRHLALSDHDQTLCGIKELDSKRQYDVMIGGYAWSGPTTSGTNLDAFSDATCEACRDHARYYLDDLSEHPQYEEKDPFFNEELRTHSAEEYQTLRREAARLRRNCKQLEAAQYFANRDLYDARFDIEELTTLLDSLEIVIRRHPELREEILSTVTSDRLRREIVGRLADPPASSSEEEDSAKECSDVAEIPPKTIE